MIKGEMKRVDLSDAYVCPHPEEHHGYFVCNDCYGRYMVQAMTGTLGLPSDESLRLEEYHLISTEDHDNG